MTFETVRENAVNDTPLLVDQVHNSGGCICRDLSAPACKRGPASIPDPERRDWWVESDVSHPSSFAKRAEILAGGLGSSV